MNAIRYAEGLKVLPVLAPQDIAATATNTSYVDLDLINWATWLVQFGNMTSDSTDTVTLTVTVSSDGASSGDISVPFKYRLSSAVDTDSMGAITSATSDGAAVVNATLDNKLVVVDLDPALLANVSPYDYRWARLVLTPLGPITNVGVIFVGEPRYPGNSIPSST
jgi:hypothetical protein